MKIGLNQDKKKIKTTPIHFGANDTVSETTKKGRGLTTPLNDDIEMFANLIPLNRWYLPHFLMWAVAAENRHGLFPRPL
jgi:hypothetical protein